MKERARDTPTIKSKNGMTKSASLMPFHGEWSIGGNASPASSTAVNTAAGTTGATDRQTDTHTHRHTQTHTHTKKKAAAAAAARGTVM